MRTSTAIQVTWGLLAMLYCAPGPVAAQPPSLLSGREVVDIVDVADVTVRDGAVSGVLINRSSRVLRDVRLLIRHAWVWKDERQPGEDNPGFAAYYVVRDTILPGGRLRFTHTPSSPLPRRTDGHFETSVEVVGFEEVGE